MGALVSVLSSALLRSGGVLSASVAALCHAVTFSSVIAFVSLQLVSPHGDVHLPPRHRCCLERRYVRVFYVPTHGRAHTSLKGFAVSLALGTASFATQHCDLENTVSM